MTNKDDIIKLILQQKILPLYSHEDAEQNKIILRACYDAGIRCFEFTNRHTPALDNFIELKEYCNKNLPGMILGCGTIKNIHDAETFINAGAAFLISPIISKELIDFTQKKKILWIPGCATATEISMAEEAGISFVKIFPANLLGGISFIKAMKDIFPCIKMLATGGINADAEEIKAWLQNGTDAAGIGSQLFKYAEQGMMLEKIKHLLREL